jgi:hypothetical protein
MRLSTRAGQVLSLAGIALFAMSHVVLAETPIMQNAAVDMRSAVESFERAVQYEHGEGVKQDLARAHTLYCEAADHGEARAYLGLGWMYLNGRGVAHDDAIAAAWFKRASDRGIPQAANLLRTLKDIRVADDLGCPKPVVAEPPPKWVPQKIYDMVERMAPEIGIEPKLVFAVIAAESAFDPNAISKKNAQGLMQLMPDTANRFQVENPFDPQENVRGGMIYLRRLLGLFRGDATLAVAAYNAGPNAVLAYGGVPPYEETKAYVARVNRRYSLVR